jgi:hypothetical protein
MKTLLLLVHQSFELGTITPKEPCALCLPGSGAVCCVFSNMKERGDYSRLLHQLRSIKYDWTPRF